MVTKISNLSLVREKIKNIHKYDFSEKDIGIIFNRPRWCTLSSRLREFQFKLLHGIIYTNHHLQKFKFVDSNLCSFCKKYDETYQHLFYTCEATQKVWESCSTFFEYIDLRTLVWKDIQFGLEIPEKGKGQLLNHILILIKFLLFSGRKKNEPPSVSYIKTQIEHDKLEEKKIAISRNSLSLHLKKWENWN